MDFGPLDNVNYRTAVSEMTRQFDNDAIFKSFGSAVAELYGSEDATDIEQITSAVQQFVCATITMGMHIGAFAVLCEENDEDAARVFFRRKSFGMVGAAMCMFFDSHKEDSLSEYLLEMQELAVELVEQCDPIPVSDAKLAREILEELINDIDGGVTVDHSLFHNDDEDDEEEDDVVSILERARKKGKGKKGD